MLCALCKLREATKKNTHYLTDGIIRSCLNQDGSNDREKGLYFDLSNDSPFIDFNFQRSTSVEQIEDTLGREINDTEIEAAKKIPYSVDDVFCPICEGIFTIIESRFSEKILPQLRGADLSHPNRVLIADWKLARLFFYLQIWRTSVCTDVVKLSKATAEALRQLILNHEQAEPEALNQFPIVVTYLETLGGDKEYTTNLVGYTGHTDPNLIIMNDFVIQFYENADSVSWFDFYGLNDPATYEEFVNTDEDRFAVRVIHNQERKQLIRKMVDTEKGKPTVEAYKQMFTAGWYSVFREQPSAQTEQEFLDELLIKKTALGVKFTKEVVLHTIVDFVNQRAGY